VPLEPVPTLIEAARQRRYAIGYFESWDIASLQGVLDAAEETRSPIIVGFNGEFLSNPERSAKERLYLYAALGRAAAESSTVPCGLIFNECSRDDWTMEAIAAGFNLVGVANTNGSIKKYAQRVAKVVDVARRYGAAVEAEVDELPCGASGNGTTGGTLTEPDAAAQFVADTGVDLLAVSVGNVHIQIDGQADLDFHRLDAIHRRVPTPLVLHGGSGIRTDSLRGAVELGVVKINYGTYLKQRCLEAFRQMLGEDVTNPHVRLGFGGDGDLLDRARRIVREAARERMTLLGCCGKG
jgi:ketose-bisphosphate aldolase